MLDIREAGNGRRGTTSSSSLDSSWKRSTRVRSNDKNVKKIAKSLVKKIENINISEEVMKRVMGQDLSIMSLDTLWHYLFENIWLNKSPKLNLLRVFFSQKVSFICYSSIWFLSHTESQNKFELGLLQFQFPQDAFKNPLLNPEPGLIKDALFFHCNIWQDLQWRTFYFIFGTTKCLY